MRDPARRARNDSRRGSGVILFIVASLLIVVIVMAISMGFRSRDVVAQSRKAIFHERCADLADMAVKEAVHHLRVNANNEDHPAFELFREQSAGASLSIPIDQLPFAQEEMGRIPGYTVGGVAVEVLRRAAIGIEAEERVPYEAVGVVRFETTVDGPSSTEVVQKDEYGFRSVLTAPPRPLDMCTFFLFDPLSLLQENALQRDANATIEEFVLGLQAYRTKLLELKAKVQDSASQLRGPAPTVAGQMDATAARIDQTLGGNWQAKDWSYVPANGGNTTGVPARLHLFDWPICVFSTADEVDLSALDIPNRIEEPVERYQQNRTRAENIQAEIDQILEQFRSVTSESQASQLYTRFDQKLQDLLVVIEENTGHMDRTLDAYKDFQDILIEVGGSAYQDLERRVRRLSSLEAPWKSHYRFHGERAAERATDFIDSDPPPSGVLYVDDPDETLRVNVRGLTGRLAVVSKGDVVVQQATVGSADEDVFVLVGYGLMEIEGDVTAAIVSWGGGYRSPGRDWTGSLILDTIPEIAPTDLILSGTLTRQPAVISGPPGNQDRPPPDPANLHIAIGPTAPYHKVFH